MKHLFLILLLPALLFLTNCTKDEDGDPCTVGATCDDGNINTVNDVYNSTCECIGSATGGDGLGALIPSESQILAVPVVDTTTLFSGRAIMSSFFELYMPPIESQGGEGSCVSFASAYAARSYHLWKDLDGSSNYDYDEVFSPEFVYNQVKVGDCNGGSYIIDNLALMKNMGVTTWFDLPYSSLDGCDDAYFNEGMYEAAKCYKIDGFYRIPTTETSFLKAILVNGFPIIFGARVDQSFYDWNRGVTYPSDFVWEESGSSIGGHAMVICGWDDSRGEGAWKIMNSWNTDWGEEGFGWIDYDFFDDVLTGSGPGSGVYDMYVMETSAPKPSCSCADTSFVDARDGQRYNMITIGTQTWMAENLNYDPPTSRDWCVNNDPANCDTYGRLYSWETALNGCPAGWHLPSDNEWKTLEIYLGMSLEDANSQDTRGTDEGGKMKAEGLTYWDSPNTGATNESCFTGLPGAYRLDYGDYGNFGVIGQSSTWWTSTDEASEGPWYRGLGHFHSTIGRASNSAESGFSVRCLKD